MKYKLRSTGMPSRPVGIIKCAGSIRQGFSHYNWAYLEAISFHIQVMDICKNENEEDTDDLHTHRYLNVI